MARFPEALAEMTCACELDPLSLVAGTGLGRVLDFSGRHDDAIEQYRRTLAIDTHAEAHFDLAMALAHVGRLAEALSAGSTAAALAPDSIVYAENVAYIRAMMGSRSEAEEFLRQLHERSETSSVSPFLQAHLLLALGRIDDAFERIHEALRLRAPEVVYLLVGPDCRPLRTDPRFEGIRQRLAFPQ